MSIIRLEEGHQKVCAYCEDPLNDMAWEGLFGLICYPRPCRKDPVIERVDGGWVVYDRRPRTDPLRPVEKVYKNSLTGQYYWSIGRGQVYPTYNEARTAMCVAQGPE